MISDRAWYWVAAGVLSLGLINSYENRQFDWVHRLSGGSAAVATRIAEKGSSLIETADVILGHDSALLMRAQACLHDIHARLACDRIEHAQRQLAEAEQQLSAAQMEKAQAEVEQLASRIESGRVAVQNQLCPRSRRLAVLPAIPSIAMRPLRIPEASVTLLQTAPMVRVPAVHIPAVVMPPVVIPGVVFAPRVPPRARAKISDPTSDGLI